METVFRVAIIYLFLIVSLRLLGKREFGQLSPLELVSLLLVPELVSNALQGDDYSLVDAVVAVCTLFALTLLTSMFMHVSKTAEKVISGEPILLVRHGSLLDKNMNRERVSVDEIYSEMHKSGLERLEEVAWAILEGDGKIAIIAENHLDPLKTGQTNNNKLAND